MYKDIDTILLKHLNEGEFGLEQESLRVNKEGKLASTSHPFNDSEIDRDFCESQIEIITSVFPTINELYTSLSKIRHKVKKTIKNNNEYLWPFSCPPKVEDESEIHIAQFSGELESKTLYRNYLAKKYGKYKMLFCGIHYNFSFTQNTIEDLFQHSQESSLQSFTNQLYLHIGQRLVEYGWLIVYLTAASPIMDKTYPKSTHQYASPRCSEIGYWNEFIPHFDFTDLSTYIRTIQSYVDSEKLLAPSELYYPIRFKCRGDQDLNHLLEQGINHIELRMLDLNPLDEEGIEKKDLLFIYLLINYLCTKPTHLLSIKEQEHCIEQFKLAARYPDDSEVFKNLNKEALRIIDEMSEMFHNQSKEIDECLLFERNKIENNENKYAVIIKNKYEKDYIQSGLSIARERS